MDGTVIKLTPSNVTIFLFFLLLSFFLRYPAFFQVPEWDESIYILIGRSMLSGHPPYTEIWDHKPPGIFFLFALAQWIFSTSLYSIRIIGCIAVSVTCYFLYRLGMIISGKGSATGLLAGILYVVYSCGSGGLASNTEIFFIPFVTAAFYLLFSIKEYPARFFAFESVKLFGIGLLLGVGIQIKYNVAFDLLALLIIAISNCYLTEHRDLRNLFAIMWKNFVLVGAGFLIVFFLTILYFLCSGHYPEYAHANFFANKMYIATADVSIRVFILSFAHHVRENFIIWLFFFFSPVYLFFSRSLLTNEAKRNIVYLTVWSMCTLLSVYFLRLGYPHYYLQIIPPLCLLSSYIVINVVYTSKKFNTVQQYGIIGLMVLVPFFYTVVPHLKEGCTIGYYRYIKGIEYWGDNSAAVAAYVSKRVTKDDFIYVADYEPIVYYLVPARLPTKYAFVWHLVFPKYERIIGIDQARELRSIMEKKPVYVIRRHIDSELLRNYSRNKQTTLPFYTALEAYLQKDYILEKSMDEADLYRLKNTVQHLGMPESSKLLLHK